MKVTFEKMRSYLDRSLLLIFILLVGLPWDRWFSLEVNLAQINMPLSWAHPFGTDGLGRDQFVRMIQAVKDTLPMIGISVGFGTIFGLSLGLWRLSWMPRNPMLKDLLVAFDGIMLILHTIPLPIAIFLFMVLTQSQGLDSLAYGFLGLITIRNYRFLTQNFLCHRNLGYWLSHRAVGGCTTQRIIEYGLKRDWKGQLFESLAFHLKVAIMTEISLSYLGFGVQEPRTSFGNLLGSELQQFLNGNWVLLVGALGMIALICEVPFAIYRIVWPHQEISNEANLGNT